MAKQPEHQVQTAERGRHRRLRNQPWSIALVVLVLLASACSGEVASDVADTVTADPTAVETTTDTEQPDAEDPAPTAEAADEPEPAAVDEPEDEPAEPDVPDAATYTDPRGGVFADFQASIDRSHPFQPIDGFCREHPAAENRVATDDGITADAIEVHHLRQRLEDLEAFGFAVDIGDTAAMFQAFIDEVNESCGGIRGRMLDLGISEFTALDANTQATACIEATEDRNTVIAMNSSGMQGTGPLCVASPDEGNTILITTQGLSEEQVGRGGPNLWSVDPVQDQTLSVLVNAAHDRGLLDGKTIGVVGVNTPGQPEATQSMVEVLEALGYNVAVNDTISCDGGANFCQGGTPDSVSNMLSNGVDAFFPTMNVTSLPIYLNEMITQGFVPGDIQMFTSTFNSQANDLTLSKIVASGSEEAGELVAGAFVVDAGDGGLYKLELTDPEPFNIMCNEVYTARTGTFHEFGDPDEHIRQSMASTVCTIVRMAARALYDAGDNPTRSDVATAMGNLGSLDVNYMQPSSFGPDKHSANDVFQTLTWTYPCELPPSFDDANTCLVPNNDWFEIAPFVN